MPDNTVPNFRTTGSVLWLVPRVRAVEPGIEGREGWTRKLEKYSGTPGLVFAEPKHVSGRHLGIRQGDNYSVSGVLW